MGVVVDAGGADVSVNVCVGVAVDVGGSDVSVGVDVTVGRTGVSVAGGGYGGCSCGVSVAGGG